MKKYSFFIQLIIILAALSLGSCKKFLDDKPVTSLTTGNAYNTASDMENALLGCYNSFYSTDYYQWEYVMVSDVRSDNAYPGGNNEETFDSFDEKTWNETVQKLNDVLTQWEQEINKADEKKLNDWYENIANMNTHNAYHTGQIVFVRKLQKTWDPAKGVK